MKISCSEELVSWLAGRKKQIISVEVAVSNASDFEVAEIYLRLVDDRFAAYLTGEKRYREVMADRVKVLLPPYHLQYDDVVRFDLKKKWLFHQITWQGIRL